jgi:anaerobic magnesium-protoporphyrin IX monomethyl ester cyclase
MHILVVKGADMKFLLLFPPSEPSSVQRDQLFKGLFPPLGLLYLGKILENEGDTVTILDFSAEPYDEQTLISAVSSTDAVGITVLSVFVDQVKELIQTIQKHRPDLPILIGGAHCTLMKEQALKETSASIGVIGDGEPVILDVKNALNKTKDFFVIPGVVAQTQHGIERGPPAELIKDLDTILFPARHLVHHLTYGREFNPLFIAGDFTAIVTSRGCPYHCRFCSRGSISQQQYRTRSTENIIAELREIKAQGYRHVAIADDCFPTNKKQAIDLFDEIRKENLGLRFSITATRVDLADQELYEKMRLAGVSHLQFGLESGNQEILDYYDKHITLDDIKNAVTLSHKTGFFTIGSFILGAPFETKQQFQQTVALAKSLPLDSVSFLPLRYMVGSVLWDQAKQEGKIKENEYLIIADKQRNLGMYTKEELIRFCSNAQRSFYFRPRFFLRLLKKSLRNDDMSFIHSYLNYSISIIHRFFH